MALLTDQTRYRLLKLLERNPHVSQRELARELGISLGKINYSLNALIKKGWVKGENFKHSQSKLQYAYLLTPKGLEEKARVTLKFLKYKQAEYEALVAELTELRKEAAKLESTGIGRE